MNQNRARLTGYRSFGGRPKRGAQSVCSLTAGWIQCVRNRSRQLESIGEERFKQFAAECRRRIRTFQDAMTADHAIESFALTAEALRRATGYRYYDVQLAGGFVLAPGTIAEIQTGEGKTITTALPAVLHAWRGKGVHVATTNEYLSKRDHDQLRPVFELLGLSSGLLCPQSPISDKVHAYSCEITYGPGYEFGFDFLKDQLSLQSLKRDRLGDRFLNRLRGIAPSEAALMQRGHEFAIIDEADSVLIDEAATPLVLSGGINHHATSATMYQFAHDMARRLNENQDFQIDRVYREVRLTSQGCHRIHTAFQQRPSGAIARPWVQLIENAIRAEWMLCRDVDYVVRGGQVLIIDQHTGRIHEERKWSRGLHQAVEIKEQLASTAENETQARITRQRYLGLYAGLAGLTGTASDSADELRASYHLPVVRIDSHRTCARMQLPLRCFDTQANKWRGIAEDAAERSRRGQPVLVGTQTIDESHRISECFEQLGITHVVLNGMQDQDEASIIARAGVAGTVTVATNMAGRGTDIKPDVAAIRAGGLHVAATEIHHSRRVDRQLAGRAARQGDPGSCQFYVSAADDLIAMRQPQLAAEIIASAAEHGESGRDFFFAIRRIQQQLETEAMRNRRQMVAHDDWLESIQAALAKRA